ARIDLVAQVPVVRRIIVEIPSIVSLAGMRPDGGLHGSAVGQVHAPRAVPVAEQPVENIQEVGGCCRRAVGEMDLRVIYREPVVTVRQRSPNDVAAREAYSDLSRGYASVNDGLGADHQALEGCRGASLVPPDRDGARIECYRAGEGNDDTVDLGALDAIRIGASQDGAVGAVDDNAADTCVTANGDGGADTVINAAAAAGGSVAAHGVTD